MPPMPQSSTLAAFLGLVVYLGGAALLAQRRGEDWPVYGGDPGGSRYSPLAQITRENEDQ